MFCFLSKLKTFQSAQTVPDSPHLFFHIRELQLKVLPEKKILINITQMLII